MTSNKNDLIVYFQDHLAGAEFATELLDDLSKQAVEAAAVETAAMLLPEIESDRKYLERLLTDHGGEPKGIKNVASWLAEKASRLKINLTTSLGVYEAVEFLCLGVLGKLALWNALEAAGTGEERNLNCLKQRAAKQHAALEALRLKLAAGLFNDWDVDARYLRFEEQLSKWLKGHGIEYGHKRFATSKAGEFDGTRVYMNSDYQSRERLYYAVHAIGSIIIWSQDRDAVQRMFDELRDAKKEKSKHAERFVEALERYRAFETESSAYAISILNEIGAAADVPAYTNHMQADLEAMTQFHEIGQGPVWNEFFARWNRDVASGDRTVKPFREKPIKKFRAAKIEKQEILQQQ
jgi:hypothetical protein